MGEGRGEGKETSEGYVFSLVFGFWLIVGGGQRRGRGRGEVVSSRYRRNREGRFHNQGTSNKVEAGQTLN